MTTLVGSDRHQILTDTQCPAGDAQLRCSYTDVQYAQGETSARLDEAGSVLAFPAADGVLAVGSVRAHQVVTRPGRTVAYPPQFAPWTGSQDRPQLDFAHGLVLPVFIPRNGKARLLGTTTYGTMLWSTQIR